MATAATAAGRGFLQRERRVAGCSGGGGEGESGHGRRRSSRLRKPQHKRTQFHKLTHLFVLQLLPSRLPDRFPLAADGVRVDKSKLGPGSWVLGPKPGSQCFRKFQSSRNL